MRLTAWVRPSEGTNGKLIRLALRWMLILATAVLLLSGGGGVRAGSFELLLILAFAASNAALSFLPESHFRSRNLEYMLVVADTFLVSLALFPALEENASLPMAFFLILMLAALGQGLGRSMAGASFVAGFYLYLTRRDALAAGVPMVTLLLRVPFLYVVALYYGSLVHKARADQEREQLLELEKSDLTVLHEVTAATTSTLELNEVLHVIVGRIARLVNALRCSILTVDEEAGCCTVLASSDDSRAAGLSIDISKYPEVRRAIETREAVVINDVSCEPMMSPVREALEKLGYQSIMVLPILYRDKVLGMLFLRAARVERHFTSQEVNACRVVANASGNAIKNAMLFDQMKTLARSRKEMADKLQNILDYFPDLIYTTDMDGTVTEFSRGGTMLLGRPRHAVLGRGLHDIYPDGEARDRMARLLRDGRALINFETTVRRADGTTRDVMVAAALLRDDAGAARGTVGIIKDITDLKAARRHLVQAEKLSAVGEVISGVAHELNNPLAGVLGYAQLLMAGPMDPRQQKAVERIFESALRCQKIVQNLLAFARRHPSEKRYLGLNGIVEKTLDLKAYQLRVNNLKVVRDLDPDLPKTMLDFNQVQQVLLNLINNAQYAVARHQGHGTLTVASAHRGDAIVLTVQDDGAGIPPDTIGKIFDPFFTTKPVGEGTGLGLSVSYGIVKEHGGRIWADSRPGEGTTINIEFPILPDATAQEQGTAVAPRLDTDQPVSLLAIDDEAVILDLIVDAFAGNGHRVDTAASAREALDKLERDHYDVVVLDLKMPEMDGRELFERIQEKYPYLARRVIFASGDTLHPDTQRFLEKSGRPCVDKPFKLEVLSSAIGRVVRGEDLRRATGGPA